MKISAVYLRFYKSFNFDYLRKSGGKARAKPWEMIDGRWEPFVEVDLDSEITTVVGANESGKSHLLKAIKLALTGDLPRGADFCRYSNYFIVERGRRQYPDLGLKLTRMSDDESRAIRENLDLSASRQVDPTYLFRMNGDTVSVWLPAPKGGDPEELIIDAEKVSGLDALLPQSFEIDPELALPDAVPLAALRGATQRITRKQRNNVLRWVEDKADQLQSQAVFQAAVPSLLPTFPYLEAGDATVAQVDLAKDLLFKVAGIDVSVVDLLHEAVHEGDEGYVKGILGKVNSVLIRKLNLEQWWAQDREFKLVLSTQGDDLVFTVEDRTHTQYTFDERSKGLKYFLSYYIQHLAHTPPEGGRDEILLMDEPDAYLSSEGQHDLVRIFIDFATPLDSSTKPIQVVYVTHSPFLIDRNRGDRIRVLDKGTGEEGSRVVRDVSRNHYEPLRSAFGGFVAETAFIGNANLFVEGPADQVLLAGISSYMRSRGAPKTQTLDLNRLTVVPAGGASHIPYLVYLARGRDAERPAVVVLLDSDGAGIEARKALRRKPHGRGEILPERFIVQIGELDATELAVSDGFDVVALEDLIPVEIAAAAGRRYAADYLGVTAKEAAALTAKSVYEAAKRTGVRSVHSALDAAFKHVFETEADVDKVGFARAVVELVVAVVGARPAHYGELERNVSALLRELSKRIRLAERERGSERITQRIRREKDRFVRNHPTGAPREEAAVLLETLEDVVGDGLEGEEVRSALAVLRSDFELDRDASKSIAGYAKFLERLEGVKYAGVMAAQEIGSASLPGLSGQAGNGSPSVQEEVSPDEGTGSSRGPADEADAK